MTKQEFIVKWNVAYEDKEQEAELAAEMDEDLDSIERDEIAAKVWNFIAKHENSKRGYSFKELKSIINQKSY
jgi:hypothetical protein